MNKKLVNKIFELGIEYGNLDYKISDYAYSNEEEEKYKKRQIRIKKIINNIEETL